MTLSSATVALPLINVLLTYLVLRALLPRFAPQHAGRRQCLLLATVIWGVSVAVLTEVASLFNRLDVRTIASVWLALDLGCVAVLLFARPRHSSRPAAGSDNQSQQNAEPLGWSWQIVLAGMAVLAIVTGGVALIAAPNDGDSMSYHLPRIMHWMQNRSLEPYPSASLHSLAIQPWAEYAMLQLHLCSGTDRFSNLVQWYAFIVQGVAVTLIAAELGAAPRTQVLAAALSLTIPAAILQASLTKNDIVASLWITLLAYYTLRLRVDFSWISLIGFGVSLGLAMLTKGPMYCFALPFVVWASITGLRRLRHAALLPLATARANRLVAQYRLLPSQLHAVRVTGGQPTLPVANGQLQPRTGRLLQQRRSRLSDACADPASGLVSPDRTGRQTRPHMAGIGP